MVPVSGLPRTLAMTLPPISSAPFRRIGSSDLAGLQSRGNLAGGMFALLGGVAANWLPSRPLPCVSRRDVVQRCLMVVCTPVIWNASCFRFTTYPGDATPFRRIGSSVWRCLAQVCSCPALSRAGDSDLFTHGGVNSAQ